MTFAELDEAGARLRLRRRTCTGRDAKVNELIVAQPSAITGIAALAAEAAVQCL